MKQHPLSAAFPSMSDDEFAALVEDIRANGLREHGTIFEGKVLDGWHRYRACEKAGVAFKSFPLPAGKDAVAFVLSRNLHRRHLSAGQRAAAIVCCTEWRDRGKPKSAPGSHLPPSAEEMAEQADVSVATIKHAKAAHRAGLTEAVKEGKVSAKQAAEIAKLPGPERKAAIEAPHVKPKKADPRDEEIARLRDELEQTRENLPELQAIASAADAMKNDEHFKKILHLEQELEQVKRRRDELMRENGELLRQVKYWKKQAQKKAA